jgi:hypothetical protein
MRSRYVDCWQRARTEQNEQQIRNREADPIVKIEFFKQQCDHEQRVHSEVELHTTILINVRLF